MRNMFITLQSRTKLLVGLVGSIAVLSIALLWMSDFAVDAERQATARQAEFRQLGLDLAKASDFLTNEARAYAASGNQRHYDNYWREVKETKTRDRVVQRLKELGAPQAELDLIEEARQNSDALVRTEDGAMKAVADGDMETARQLMFGDEYDRQKAIIMKPLAEFQKTMNDRAAEETADARSRASLLSRAAEISIMALTALMVGVLILFFNRKVVQPVTVLSDVVDRLTKRDYGVEVPGKERADEIGQLANAIQIFKENAIERERLEEEQRKESEAKVARANAVEALIAEFENASGEILESLAGAAEEMNATANSLVETADRTAHQSSATSAAAQQTGANVQSVAAATEELSASIGEIGKRVTETANMVRSAAGSMELSETKMGGLINAVSEVGTVISVITDIAEQTNLLALNATIEAARAGEAGKGFAVVASEVKNLATQTHKATEEVSAIIRKIETETEEAGSAIKEVARQMEQVNENAAGISAATEQQAVATQDISRNVQEAASGTENVTSGISEVSVATGETRSASEQVLDVASKLSQQADTMNQRIRAFLSGIKAA